jgi:hypothetical protein
MFEKKEINFGSKKYFGNFKNNLDTCFCKTSKMLFSGKLNMDGTIDEDKVDTFTRADLWSYIYYIYYYNNSDVQEFKLMKTKKTGLANATFFYTIVTSVVHRTSEPKLEALKSQDLIKFINYIIEYNQDQLVNPIFDYLKVLQDKRMIRNLEGFKLITGNSSGEIKVVNANSPNANIKIGLVRKSNS